MPVDCGSITPNSAQAAPAASAAVPPARMTSMATSAASGCDVATIAFWAWTVERPAKWKFLIASAFFSAFFRYFLGTPRGAYGGFADGSLAYSSPAGQWLACQEPAVAIRGIRRALRGFPCPACLIN